MVHLIVVYLQIVHFSFRRQDYERSTILFNIFQFTLTLCVAQMYYNTVKGRKILDDYNIVHKNGFESAYEGVIFF